MVVEVFENSEDCEALGASVALASPLSSGLEKEVEGGAPLREGCGDVACAKPKGFVAAVGAGCCKEGPVIVDGVSEDAGSDCSLPVAAPLEFLVEISSSSPGVHAGAVARGEDFTGFVVFLLNELPKEPRFGVAGAASFPFC